MYTDSNSGSDSEEQSTDQSTDADTEGINPNDRQPAKRVTVAELSDATVREQLGRDERSPKFSLLPTGERANRVLLAGTITEIEELSDQNTRARIAMPGHGDQAIYAYAGQYQPDIATQLDQIGDQFNQGQPAVRVVVIGKPGVYVPETEDGQGDPRVQISNPEAVLEVTEDVWNRHIADIAEDTFERVETMLNGEAPAGQAAADAYGIDEDGLEGYHGTGVAMLNRVFDEGMIEEAMAQGIEADTEADATPAES